ncbi:hypothetical protein Lesp02_14600 [Lentzea sp. NBRC 105346]|uniref:hypothetical protein n=1 Tax=Lentzea sp. NBRC 105346 TaxID=3032205 RepID=UPI0024A42CD7|nr:hypothetical protein [Lentzea sp. NBRC 105346]GLZ29270.1 hypothetical protein Lesp02_14600 [Lentzea sp. NBRC 105346]
MNLKANRGPGQFIVENIGSPSGHLTEGRRIVRIDGDEPVPEVDVYTLDYQSRLDPLKANDSALRRGLLAIGYLIHTIIPVRAAIRRQGNVTVKSWAAKGWRAKIQLLLGFAAIGLTLMAAVASIWTVLETANLVDTGPVPSSWSAALKLGAAGVTSFLFFKLRRIAATGAGFVQQFIEYTKNELHAASVAAVLADAVDELIEQDGKRSIHLVAHSFGCLVAFDFLYPYEDQHLPADARHARAITTLFTMGCPLDFVRFYEPGYLRAPRNSRISELKWTNVFIPADVFGSNLDDHDDRNVKHGTDTLGINATVKSIRYTDEKLTLLSTLRRRGFLSHNDYWSEPERENCLHLVMKHTWAPDIHDFPAKSPGATRKQRNGQPSGNAAKSAANSTTQTLTISSRMAITSDQTESARSPSEDL